MVRLKRGQSAGTKKDIRAVSPCFPSPFSRSGSTSLFITWKPRVLRELLSCEEHGEFCYHAFMTLIGVGFHPNVLSTRAPFKCDEKSRFSLNPRPKREAFSSRHTTEGQLRESCSAWSTPLLSRGTHCTMVGAIGFFYLQSRSLGLQQVLVQFHMCNICSSNSRRANSSSSCTQYWYCTDLPQFGQMLQYRLGDISSSSSRVCRNGCILVM